MGKSQSKEQDSNTSVSAPDFASNTSSNEGTPSTSFSQEERSEGRCPMKRTNGGYFGRFSGNPHVATTGVGECPVKKSVQYNVYSQPMDLTNNMPAVANQLPAANQKDVLSTERVSSTIPKGGAEDGTTWSYPSPQMFYNSLVRKNKLGDDTDESDMESVVALHNNMNEKTWAKVLEWEQLLSDDREETQSKLLKFEGRPMDLSPKARFKHFILGHPLPFDRHDWTIVRGDGKEVRYVIDYYHDETRASTVPGSGMPSLRDLNAVQSILVDVRPALDSPRTLMERMIFMPYARRISGTSSFEPLPLSPTKELRNQVNESLQVWKNIQQSVSVKGGGNDEAVKESTKHEDERRDNTTDQQPLIVMSREEAKTVAKSFASILKDCEDARKVLNTCEEHTTAHAHASLSLTLCMAKVLCPLQHNAVMNSVNANNNEAEEIYNARLDSALENVSLCVANSNERAKVAKTLYPNEFSNDRS